MTSPPRVLVSILNHNKFEEAADTIRAFRAQTYAEMTLQLIDNASTTDCLTRLRALFPDLEVVASSSNLGYAGGNNLALERGVRESFDYVLVCNADILVEPDAVANLIETGESLPRIGLVGGVEVDFASGRVRTTGGLRFPNWRFRFGWPISPEPKGQPWRRVLYVQGALGLFARRALELGVRFDDQLFMYWEEIDLAYTLSEKQLWAYVDYRVRYRHRNKPKTFNNRTGYFQQRNRVYLARKHFPVWKSRLYVAYATLLEVPLKFVVRTIQGYPSFAWACVLGHRDGLAGRMGRGRVESLARVC